MKGIIRLLIVFFLLALSFLFSQKTQAANDHLVINEIYPAPISDCGISIDPDCSREWIELYNPTMSDIDLTDYILSDANGGTFSLKGKTIPSNGYLVVFDGSGGFGFVLNNDGDTITLINNIEVDILNYPDLTSHKGKSYARIPDASDNYQIVDQTCNARNPEPITYSDKISINEILPRPATVSGDEFIELYNSGHMEVDLSGWRLDDSSAGSDYEIPNGTIIGAKKYLVFCKESMQAYCDFTGTKIALNDTSSDYVILIDPNGDIKSQSKEYSKTKRGQSYSWFVDGWKWTTKLTPEKENIYEEEIILSDEDIFIPEINIESAREFSLGETVKTTGVVSVLPGKLSSQYFYIQDDNSGIQIYSYHKLFPLLKLGDLVAVTGEIAEYMGERRIKITTETDIEILSSRSPPEAKKVKIDNLGEGLEGQYIVVSGVVTKTSGSVFYIHGSGEIQVSIREGTGIIKPKMRVGDKVEIAGILSQYGDYYRILPTRQDDVKIVKSASLAKSGADLYLSFAIILISMVLWSIFQKAKKKQRTLL